MTIIGLFITFTLFTMFHVCRAEASLRVAPRCAHLRQGRGALVCTSVDFVKGSRRIQFKRFQEISSRNFPFPTTPKSIQVNPSHDDLLGNNQTSHRWLQLCSVTVTFQTVSFQTKLSTSWMKLLRRLGWPYGRCRRLLDSCMLLSSADITR